MLTNPKFYLIGIPTLILISFVLLKVIAATAKRPSRDPSATSLTPCPDSPNCVCSDDPRDSHNITPLKFNGDPPTALTKIKSILEELGGSQVKATDQYVWFEFRTPLVGFTDDVECRLNSQANQIEIRSASRVGHSDLGANRKRVETIRAAFEKK